MLLPTNALDCLIQVATWLAKISNRSLPLLVFIPSLVSMQQLAENPCSTFWFLFLFWFLFPLFYHEFEPEQEFTRQSNLWRRYVPLFDVRMVWINVKFEGNVVDEVLDSHLKFYYNPKRIWRRCGRSAKLNYIKMINEK